MSCIVCYTCGEIKTPLPSGDIYRIYACRKCLNHFKTVDNIKKYHAHKESTNNGFDTNQIELRFN